MWPMWGTFKFTLTIPAHLIHKGEKARDHLNRCDRERQTHPRNTRLRQIPTPMKLEEVQLISLLAVKKKEKPSKSSGNKGDSHSN